MTIHAATDLISTACAGQPAIAKLEEFLLEQPQVDIPVEQFFSGKMYVRTILIPADTLITGRVYLQDHVDIMSGGDITVTGVDGPKRLMGFHILERPAGKKQAAYTHAPTRWITICNCADMPDGMTPEDYYMNELTRVTYEEALPLLESDT